MSCQSRFDARYWMLGAGALGRPRGMEWGGREEGSGWGTHVYLWRIHILKVRLLKLRARAFKKIIWGGSKRRNSFFCLEPPMEVGKLLTCHYSFRRKGPPQITRKFLQRNSLPNYKTGGLLLSHLPIKQPPRSSKTPAGPAHPTTWGLPRRGLADRLHLDASFSRV